MCFDAQQAAEKALKAVLIARGISFPYVHDLGRLLTLLEQRGEQIPPVVREAGRLTRFAVASRYPGITEPVTEEEYANAATIAEAIVTWAAETLPSN